MGKNSDIRVREIENGKGQRGGLVKLTVTLLWKAGKKLYEATYSRRTENVTLLT